MKKEDTGVVIINGVEWHQKKTYSEDDVLAITRAFDKEFYQGIAERNGRIDEWFKQFKNKSYEERKEEH